MKARLALMLGGAAVAGAAVYRLVRRAPAPLPIPDAPAEELRAKLAESRAVLEERDEFEAAEIPVDQGVDLATPHQGRAGSAGAADPNEQVAPVELGDRRQAVHDRGRHVAEEMRRGSTE